MEYLFFSLLQRERPPPPAKPPPDEEEEDRINKKYFSLTASEVEGWGFILITKIGVCWKVFQCVLKEDFAFSFSFFFFFLLCGAGEPGLYTC
jgi:hypothetical protein